MFKKTTFYKLGVAAVLIFGSVAFWGERRSSLDSTRANAAVETEVQTDRVEFLSDYDEAMRVAAAESKPALIFFMTKYCKHSQYMLRTSFTDPEVERLAREFVCVELDMDDPKNEEVCDAFDVVSSPTALFLSSYGVTLQRASKAQSGESLRKQMQSALTTVAWRAAHLGEDAAIRR